MTLRFFPVMRNFYHPSVDSLSQKYYTRTYEINEISSQSKKASTKARLPLTNAFKVGKEGSGSPQNKRAQASYCLGICAMALPQPHRLTRKKDFDTVFRKGKTVQDSFFFIKAAPNNLDVSRFGIVIPARLVKTAVKRNVVRRLLSEVIRGMLDEIPQGLDVVLSLKKTLPVGAEQLRTIAHDLGEKLSTRHG